MSEVEQIARSLTKAQREWIAAAKETLGGNMALPAYISGKRVQRLTVEAVERVGIAAGNYPPLMFLTPLGLSVRALLAKEQPE